MLEVQAPFERACCTGGGRRRNILLRLCGKIFHLFFILFLCVTFSSASPQIWYLSNAAGDAFMPISEKAPALREEWALAVDQKDGQSLPGVLRPYYGEGFSAEQQVLYNEGKPVRWQWIFHDSAGRMRLNASLSAALMGLSGGGDGEDRAPFIELYSEDGMLAKFQRLEKGGEGWSVLYTYKDKILVASQTLSGKAVLWNDEFRYTRSLKLRGIERNYTREPDEEKKPLFVRFPLDGDFVNPESPYDYELISGALRDVFQVQSAAVNYTTGDLGQVLKEEWIGEGGTIIAELTNEWNEDRIAAITWKTETGSGRVEFDYSASGDRIGERDFRNGILERRVTRNGEREIEELFRGEKTVLRSVWEDGRKILEERL